MKGAKGGAVLKVKSRHFRGAAQYLQVSKKFFCVGATGNQPYRAGAGGGCADHGEDVLTAEEARGRAGKPGSLPTPVASLAVLLEPQFDFNSAEYRRLCARAGASAFQSPAWLVGVTRRLVPKRDAKPFTVTVRDRGGRLLLVLPFIRTHRKGIRTIEFTDLGVSDYNAAVYDPSDAPALLADPTLHVRIGKLLARCDVVSLQKLPGDDAVLSALFPLARRTSMRFSTYPARLFGTWSEWRSERLDKSFRYYLDRKRRALARTDSSSFQVMRSEQDIRQAFRALRRFRAARFEDIGATDLVQEQTYFDFYVQQALEGASDGSTHTYCLMVGGAPAAVIFGLVHEGTFSLLLLGFDQKAYRRLSLGLLLIENCMQHAVEEGLTTFDFTIGDHAYKTQFGAVVAPISQSHWPRSLRGWLSVLAREIECEAKRKLKRYFK